MVRRLCCNISVRGLRQIIELKLIVLLIDERPEEVTDMRRNVDGEVVASSLDEDVKRTFISTGGQAVPASGEMDRTSFS